ncbi:hypothetical protein D3C87_1932800 [compost metagenome]
MPVSSVVAAPVLMVIFFLSFERACTARPTEEEVSSMIESTCSVSYHCRAMLEATSALFWWSAVTTSTGAPSTLPPKSSTAIFAAS